MGNDIKKDVIGGQAVIEGVMMLNKDKMAIGVRKPNKEIAIKKEKLKSIKFEVPIIRGFIKLFFMMYIGIKALNYSSDIALEEEEEELSKWHVALMIIFSLALAIALFKFLPLFLANMLTNKLGSNYIWFNVMDGIIKISLFVLYVYLISFMKDVKTLFQYHGAEHKTVYCYEKGLKLTPENVQKFSTLHPRCGTAFIMIVLIFSIIVYTFIPQDLSLSMKLLYRVLLLPIIAGISYEILRYGAKYPNNIIIKIFVRPGLWLQRITTQEPSKKQIEVAIAAMKAVI